MRLRPFAAVFLTACTWTALVVVLVSASFYAFGVGDGPVYWATAAVAGGLTFSWAAYRVRVEIDDAEIRVFNVRRTYRVPWNSVDRIGVVRWWLSPNVMVVGSAAVRLTTTSGQRVVIDASMGAVPNVLAALERYGAHRPHIAPG